MTSVFPPRRTHVIMSHAPVLTDLVEVRDFSEIMTSDIVTFGSCKSEWVVTDIAYFPQCTASVRCIKHPIPELVGRHHIVDETFSRVWRVT